jgi:hypothetical protein
MTTSRSRRRRTGLIGYLGNVVDDTKDYIDDVLDWGRDSARDERGSARRVLRGDDDDADLAEDIAALRDDLRELADRVERLGSDQEAKTR